MKTWGLGADPPAETLHHALLVRVHALADDRADRPRLP
jgi:hypothetical protein